MHPGLVVLGGSATGGGWGELVGHLAGIMGVWLAKKNWRAISTPRSLDEGKNEKRKLAGFEKKNWVLQTMLEGKYVGRTSKRVAPHLWSIAMYLGCCRNIF